MQRVNFLLKVEKRANAILDRSLDSHLVELHARRHGFKLSLDGERPRHLYCPVTTGALSSISFISTNVDDGRKLVNRNKFHFHNMLKKETIQLQCTG